MRNAVRQLLTSLVAVICMLGVAPLGAKPSAITLSDLVHRSSVIVFGRLESVSTTGARWIPFRPTQVLKGNASIATQQIQLCNSPPKMQEYPDLSKMAGDVVLFLTADKRGCFEFTHTTTSVVEVHEGNATTAAISDQPVYQPWSVFEEKVRRFVATQDGSKNRAT
jgi:hypothetical protein